MAARHLILALILILISHTHGLLKNEKSLKLSFAPKRPEKEQAETAEDGLDTESYIELFKKAIIQKDFDEPGTSKVDGNMTYSDFCSVKDYPDCLELNVIMKDFLKENAEIRNSLSLKSRKSNEKLSKRSVYDKGLQTGIPNYLVPIKQTSVSTKSVAPFFIDVITYLLDFTDHLMSKTPRDIYSLGDPAVSKNDLMDLLLNSINMSNWLTLDSKTLMTNWNQMKFWMFTVMESDQNIFALSIVKTLDLVDVAIDFLLAFDEILYRIRTLASGPFNFLDVRKEVVILPEYFSDVVQIIAKSTTSINILTERSLPNIFENTEISLYDIRGEKSIEVGDINTRSKRMINLGSLVPAPIKEVLDYTVNRIPNIVSAVTNLPSAIVQFDIFDAAAEVKKYFELTLAYLLDDVDMAVRAMRINDSPENREVAQHVQKCRNVFKSVHYDRLDPENIFLMRQYVARKGLELQCPDLKEYDPVPSMLDFYDAMLEHRKESIGSESPLQMSRQRFITTVRQMQQKRIL